MNETNRAHESVLRNIVTEICYDTFRLLASDGLPELHAKFGTDELVRAAAQNYISAKSPTYYDDDSAVTVDELAAAMSKAIEEDAQGKIRTVGYFIGGREMQASMHLSLTAPWTSYAANATEAIKAEAAKGILFPHETPVNEEFPESPFLNELFGAK